MSEEKKKLVVLSSHGLDDERTVAAWTIANGGITSGLDVTMFLVSSGVDVVRKKAADVARLNPLDPPLKELIESLLERGGKIYVCPPCAAVRGYEQDDLIEGATIHGASVIHEQIKEGATTLSM